MIRCVKHCDSNNTIKINDDRLLKENTKTWGRVRILINNEFDSQPVYGDNDKYVKAKINLHGDKVNTNFKGKKYQKKMLESVIRVCKKYYPQALLLMMI